MKNILFKGKKIFFSDNGKGKTLVFLHGFAESSGIWDEFVDNMSRNYRIITIDLAGHGKSELVGKVLSMELQADVVHAVLKERKAKSCIMIGHSMGGYTALAFAGKYPEMLKGLCLFHSHPWPDTATDKTNRERTIRIAGEDRSGFLSTFFPSLFPAGSRKNHSPEIKTLIRRSKEMTKEAIIAAQEGMKIRENQSSVLKSIQIPVLFIIGLKDPKAPIARLWAMISLPHQADCLILREAGHMGFIEFPSETIASIKSFAKKTFRKD